jgi:hypothetical protein
MSHVHVFTLGHLAQAVICVVDSLLGSGSDITKEFWLGLPLLIATIDTVWVGYTYIYSYTELPTEDPAANTSYLKKGIHNGRVLILWSIVILQWMFTLLLFCIYPMDLANTSAGVDSVTRFKEFLTIYPIMYGAILAAWSVLIAREHQQAKHEHDG